MRKVLISATLVTLATLALTAGGCKSEDVSSEDIKTHGIYAEFDVVATSANAVRVTATMIVGGSDSNTYVQLKGKDSISATGGTETKVLNMESSGDKHWYENDFGTAAAGTPYTIDFEHLSDVVAPNSTGILPAPFDIGPLPTNKPSRATDPVTITWGPTQGIEEVYIFVTGDCIYPYKNESVGKDPGTFTIPAGSLDSTHTNDGPNDCTLTVQVVKIRPGDLDPHFGGGYIHLQQMREATFMSAQ